MKFRRKFYGYGFICGAAAILLWICSPNDALADGPPWSFDLPHVGRVLDEGGWFQEYSLLTINASPEFNFPLQLVYLNTRATYGMFGAQWFCPQLESSVIPQGNGGFSWQTPAGNVLPFHRCDPQDASLYSDPSGAWRAKAVADHQEIYNQDGWHYAYSQGRCRSLTSPTGRVLQFNWNADDLDSLALVDPASGQRPAEGHPAD